MPQASVKRLIEADKQKLIELVLDIEKYKDFIPYCLDSKFMNAMIKVIKFL